jgi:hypothetical protein
MKNGSKFCANCGANNEEYSAQPTEPAALDGGIPVNDFGGKNKKKGKLLTTLAVILIIVIVAVVRLSNLDAYRVKGGHPKLYPNTTWEDALKDVCKKSKWKAYKEDGERYVKYTGVVKSDGDKLEIIFKIDGDEFSIESIEKDGEEGGASIIKDIFTGDL